MQNPLRPAAGQTLFCTDEILTCRVRCDIANDATYPKLTPDAIAECLGLARTALLIVSTFFGVRTERRRPGGFLYMTDPVVLNASTHRSIVFQSGIAPRRSTLNFRWKRQTVTTESLFLKNCSTANTRCCTFQCAMATETALSELSAGSCPMSSTPPLPSTSHLKNVFPLLHPVY